jgi:hypothetical protein
LRPVAVLPSVGVATRSTLSWPVAAPSSSSPDQGRRPLQLITRAERQEIAREGPLSKDEASQSRRRRRETPARHGGL